jgi:uncharacterized protein YjbI with pentapeptide repeats
MSVIKPQALFVRSNPLQVEDGRDLVVSAVLGFKLSDPHHFLNESEIQDILEKQIPKEETFESWMPKVHGELLVWGSAFSVEQTTSMEVSVSCGPISRTLVVKGRRSWERSRVLGWLPTRFEGFTQMPLTWQKAAGGAELSRPYDMLGGDILERLENGETIDLPSIEAIASAKKLGPTDALEPVCFSAMPLAWAKHAGTFDMKWFSRQFPAQPDDYDWEVWNRAQPEQRLVHGFWRGGEAIHIKGMVPNWRSVDSAVPEVAVRFFTHWKKNPGELIPYDAKLDTVALFPAAIEGGNDGVGLLIYRTRISDVGLDSANIWNVLVGAEWTQNPKPYIHYYKEYKARINPETAGDAMFNDLPLMPEKIEKSATEVVALDVDDLLESPEDRVAKEAAQRASERRRSAVKALGLPATAAASLLPQAILAGSSGVPITPEAQANNQVKLKDVNDSLAALEKTADEEAIKWGKEAADARPGEKLPGSDPSQADSLPTSMVVSSASPPEVTPATLEQLAKELENGDHANVQSVMKGFLGNYSAADASVEMQNMLADMGMDASVTSKLDQLSGQALSPEAAKQMAGLFKATAMLMSSTGNDGALPHMNALFSGQTFAGQSAEMQKMAAETMAKFKAAEDMSSTHQMAAVLDSVTSMVGGGGGQISQMTDTLAALKGVMSGDSAGMDTTALFNKAVGQALSGAAQANTTVGQLVNMMENLKGASSWLPPGMSLGENSFDMSKMLASMDDKLQAESSFKEAVDRLKNMSPDEPLFTAEGFNPEVMQVLGAGGLSPAKQLADIKNTGPDALAKAADADVVDVLENEVASAMEEEKPVVPATPAEIVAQAVKDNQTQGQPGPGFAAAALAGLLNARRLARVGSFFSPEDELAAYDQEAIQFINQDRHMARGEALVKRQLSVGDSKKLGETVIELHKKGASFKGCDISGADLTGANLKGINFEGVLAENVNFLGADLTGAHCQEGTFIGACFERATLQESNFKLANLTAVAAAESDWRYATLDRAQMQEGDFEKTQFEKASLKKADASKANFVRANLERSVASQATFEGVNLALAVCNQADFRGTSLMEATVSGCRWRSANLDGASFIDAQGSDMDVSKASMIKTAFIGAELPRLIASGALAKDSTWNNARLPSSKFDQAVLENAIFSRAELNYAQMGKSILKGVHFNDARLVGADFQGAQLYQANLRKANALGANFAGANLDGLYEEGANLDLVDMTGANVVHGMLSIPRQPKKGAAVPSRPIA